MQDKLKEGIVWIAFFLSYMIWATVSKNQVFRYSEKKRLRLVVISSILFILFFACLNIVLGIKIRTVMLVFFFYYLLFYLPDILGQKWRDIESGRINTSTSIVSWYVMSGLHLTVGILLNSSIWFIGAAILFIQAITNTYFELGYKEALKINDLDVNPVYYKSGFALNYEYPSIISSMFTCFLYFPLLYFIPSFSLVFQYIIKSEWLVTTFLPIFSAGVITAAYSSGKVEKNKKNREIRAKIYVGFFLINFLFLVLILFGSIFHQMRPFNSEEAFSLFVQTVNINSIIDQVWFAAVLALFLNIVCYGTVILYDLKANQQ